MAEDNLIRRYFLEEINKTLPASDVSPSSLVVQMPRSRKALGRQGQIVAHVKDDLWLAQIYSWVDGETTGEVLVTEEAMLSFTFFEGRGRFKKASRKAFALEQTKLREEEGDEGKD